MTQMDEINKLINECYWRQDACGIPICRGSVLPCQKTIDNGECDTLKEYFKKEREKNGI